MLNWPNVTKTNSAWNLRQFSNAAQKTLRSIVDAFVLLVSLVNLNIFISGEIKPVLKSAPEPKKNDGPVKVVVGNTFEKLVMDESKDVLVEFYAPWCGHCKSLEPIYKKLGQKYKNEKSLVIAKIDATANDVPPEYTVEGFPTIYFAPPGKKSNPMKYDGERTLDGISKFIQDNAVVSLKNSKDEL